MLIVVVSVIDITPLEILVAGIAQTIFDNLVW